MADNAELEDYNESEIAETVVAESSEQKKYASLVFVVFF